MRPISALDDHVDFLGLVPYDRSTGCRATDVCTVPDPSNAYNDRCTMIKVMEYMALERPIVAYDLPETRVSAGARAVRDAERPAGLRPGARAARGRRRPPARGRRGPPARRAGPRVAYSVPPLLQAYADLFARPSAA